MTRIPRRLVVPPLSALAVVVVLLATGCTGTGAGTTAPSSGARTAAPSSAAGGAPGPSSSLAPSLAPGPSLDLSDCPTSQPAALPAGQKRTVTIDTPKGAIVLEIDGALSPIAAGNVVALAGCGWYDGVVFHRLVPGFVIQGGDGEFGRVGADGKLAEPGRAGSGGPGYTIKDEDVTAKYGRGVVAMARTDAPDSVGSQFFIVLDDQAASVLASYNTYQIVGKVTAGLDVVDAIAAMPNAGEAAGNAAIDPVPMTKVTVSQ
jgi:cyclophilin family peptidyl-prolyl cis-trans isomerase